MSGLPQSWLETTVSNVVTSFETTEPTREPKKLFTYVDIGSIDNTTQVISDPKVFIGAEAPSRARRVIKSGDSLFSTVRTYLKNIAIVPDELDGALTSTGIAVLRPGPAILSRYLYHWVKSDEFVAAIGKAEDGTMYPAVRDSDVTSASIPLAPLAEQRRILAKLDSLSARSSRARNELDRIPILIARYKQAILAKLLESYETTLIPLSELIYEGPTNGYSPRASVDGNGSLSLKLTATTRGYFDLSEKAVKRIGETISVDSRLWLEPGDLLIQRANSIEYVGAAAIYEGPRLTYIYPDLMMRIRVANPHVRRFLWRFLNSPQGRAYFVSNATGTAGNMPKINGETVRSLPVPMPALSSLPGINSTIDSAFNWLAKVATEHARADHLLPQLSQAILAKAFRGELVPQDPNDEPASELLLRAKNSGGQAQARKAKASA